MRRIIFFLIVSFISFLLIGCLSSTSEDIDIILDKRLIADRLGNYNNTYDDELELVDDYFEVNSKAYALGPGYFDFMDGVPADTMRSRLYVMSGIYNSEEALRNDFEGIGAKCPYIGIYVMKYDGEVHVDKYYRCPGPNISGSEWEIVNIY